MEPFQQVGASPALLLAPDDNIAIAVRDMPAGTIVRVGDYTVTLGDAVKVGHKFAVRAIPKDERIVKYGAPIGRAIAAIAPGEYVHIQNVTSDYIPTYTFDAGHEFLPESH
jgi:altronate dehydratase small subunit